MDRRDFTLTAVRALLGGAAITVSGCAASSPTASSPPVVDVAGTIDPNHGHTVVITAAQLRDGGALDLDIQGAARHTHTVSLSGAEVVRIRGGAMVQKQSSGDRHTHLVTFNA